MCRPHSRSFVLLGLVGGPGFQSQPLTPCLRACVCRISAGKSKEVSPLLECFVVAQLVSVVVGCTSGTGFIVTFSLTGSASGVLLSPVCGAAAAVLAHRVSRLPLSTSIAICSC